MVVKNIPTPLQMLNTYNQISCIFVSTRIFKVIAYGFDQVGRVADEINLAISTILVPRPINNSIFDI